MSEEFSFEKPKESSPERKEDFLLFSMLKNAATLCVRVGNTEFTFPTPEGIETAFYRIRPSLIEEYDAAHGTNAKQSIENISAFVKRGAANLAEAHVHLVNGKDEASQELVKQARIEFEKAQEISKIMEERYFQPRPIQETHSSAQE